MTWTVDDLRKLDLKYAKQGVHMHQRPFHAARELLGPAFSLGMGGNPEVQRIMAAYEAMLPEANSSWPGMGIGLVVSVDQVRKVILPVIFGGGGGPLEMWTSCGFASREDWWRWCREDRDVAAESHFAFADLYDFNYGVDDLKSKKPEAETLWHMAGSNLGDAANALPSAFSVDSLIQPICMVAELSIKAALVFVGASPQDFKGPKGHDLVGLAKRLSVEIPHRDDPLVQKVTTKLPPYVKSRYEPAGLTRIEVVRLALAVQFVAASSVRRVSQRDLASQMESGDWPAPRASFFS
jgi:HEPN domain-containing protein